MRDPWDLAIELLLRAADAGILTGSRDSQVAAPVKGKATLVPCTVGEAARAPAGRVTVCVVDERIGREVVEVVTWKTPEARDARLGRLIRAGERLRWARAERVAFR